MQSQGEAHADAPWGLIDDYPQQCFPCDVVVAVAMVRRADSALGTDRRKWAERALRKIMMNFPGQLPPYMARQESGLAIAPSRGCANGFFFPLAREIDPALADSLYQVFAASFWQETGLAAGWREFPHGSNHPSTCFDPDSGPVVGGFGTSATGLGLGAARLHADHERACRLGAGLIAAAVPLPDGSLLVPRCISDRDHAPLFAELVILHQLSLCSDDAPQPKAAVPPGVWGILAVEFLLGALLLRVPWWGLKRSPPRRSPCR